MPTPRLKFRALNFAYIDLTAFSSQVQSRDPNEIHIAVLELMAGLRRQRGIKWQSISDSFFIASSNLDRVREAVAFFQECAARHGFLVRGAITRGDIAWSDGIIFGDPVVRAVRLEQDLRVPVVIIPKEDFSNVNERRSGIPTKSGRKIEAAYLCPDVGRVKELAARSPHETIDLLLDLLKS